MRPNYINKYTTLQHLSHHFTHTYTQFEFHTHTPTHSHKYTGKPYSNLFRTETLMMISRRTNFHDFHFHTRGKVWRERKAKKWNCTDILLSSLINALLLSQTSSHDRILGHWPFLFQVKQSRSFWPSSSMSRRIGTSTSDCKAFSWTWDGFVSSKLHTV